MSRFARPDNTTEHRYVEDRLLAYLDGELTSQEKAIIDRHLADCPACQWNLKTLQQTVQWTRELPAVPVPRVFTIPVPARPARAPRRRWSLVPALQGATAVIALLLFFVITGDVFFTGFLPFTASQPAALREQRVATTEAAKEPVVTLLVEELRVEVTNEVEAPVAQESEMVLEGVMAQPTPAPAPAEALPAATMGPAPTAMPPAGGAGEALEETAADEASSQLKVAEASPTPTAVASATSDATPTLEPLPTPSPALLAPAAAEPTLAAEIAEAREPAGLSPEGEREGLLSVSAPSTSWLRLAEYVLAATLLILGTITIILTILRRRAR